MQHFNRLWKSQFVIGIDIDIGSFKMAEMTLKSP